MALPRQLPTNYDGNRIVGPFISSGGAAYYVADDDSAVAVDVLKSADPSTTAFTAQDTSDNPTTSSTDAIRGTTGVSDVDAYQVGDVLHVVVSSLTIPAMGDYNFFWDYFTFDMSTDQWTTTGGARGAVYAPSVDSSLSSNCPVRIMVRSQDGDVVIVGKGPHDTDMGSKYRTVYHTYYNGTSWSTATRVDEGIASQHHDDPAISDDYTTDGDYLVTWDGGGDYSGRMMTGASHTQQTFQDIDNTAVALSSARPLHRIIQYNDGGTWRGSAIYKATSGELAAATWDPTQATPTFSTTQDITGSDTSYNDRSGLQAYDSSDDTRYCIYTVQGTPDEIKYVSSVNEAAWGSATQHSTPANDTRLLPGHATVGTSPSDGSSTVIAFLYQDATAGTAYYDEITLSAGGTELTPGTGTLTLTGPAPTADVTSSASETPTTGSLTLTGFAVALAVTLTPATGALALTGPAPTEGISVYLTPTVGALSLTGPAPTEDRTANVWLTPAAGALNLTGPAPTVDASADVGVTPATASLALTGPAGLAEASANTWLDPPTASLTLAGPAPLLSLPVGVTPSTGTLTLTGPALTLAVGVTPSAASLTLTGPPASFAIGLAPATGSLALTGPAPTADVAASVFLTPSTGPLTLSGLAPTLGVSISLAPTTGALTLTGPAASLSVPVTLAPATGSLSLTGPAPTATAQEWHSTLGLNALPQARYNVPFPTKTANENVESFPSTGSLVLTGPAPSADVSGVTLFPATGALSLTGPAPALTVPELVTPSTGALSLTGPAPTVDAGASVGVTPATASLTFTGPAPTAQADNTFTPGTASLLFRHDGAPNSPTVYAQSWHSRQGLTATPQERWNAFAAKTATGDADLRPTLATLTLVGPAPTVSQSDVLELTPSTGSLTFAGWLPTLDIGVSGGSSTWAEPLVGALTLTAPAPTADVTENVFSAPAAASLTLTGPAPSLSLPVSVTPATGSLTLTGPAPSVSTPVGVAPATATLTLTGPAPNVAVPVVVTPATGSLTITGPAPSLAYPGSDPVGVTVGSNSLVLTGYGITIWIEQNVGAATWTDQTTGAATWTDQTVGSSTWSDA